MCKVTVVIPNYNGEKYLVPCLASLYEETRAEIKVIVVDNGSKDASSFGRIWPALGIFRGTKKE